MPRWALDFDGQPLSSSITMKDKTSPEQSDEAGIETDWRQVG
jgi:hypothetical protein